MDLATSYNNIGGVYDSQGQYQEALSYYEKSREIQERLGLEVDLATSYNNIGGIYRSQGQYQEALSYYEKSREIQERLRLEVDLARSYNNIGIVYYFLKNYEKAEKYVSRAIQIWEKIGHIDLNTVRQNLEIIQKSQRDSNITPPYENGISQRGVYLQDFPIVKLHQIGQRTKLRPRRQYFVIKRTTKRRKIMR